MDTQTQDELAPERPTARPTYSAAALRARARRLADTVRGCATAGRVPGAEPRTPSAELPPFEVVALDSQTQGEDALPAPEPRAPFDWTQQDEAAPAPAPWPAAPMTYTDEDPPDIEDPRLRALLERQTAELPRIVEELEAHGECGRRAGPSRRSSAAPGPPPELVRHGGARAGGSWRGPRTAGRGAAPSSLVCDRSEGARRPRASRPRPRRFFRSEERLAWSRRRQKLVPRRAHAARRAPARGPAAPARQTEGRGGDGGGRQRRRQHRSGRRPHPAPAAEEMAEAAMEPVAAVVVAIAGGGDSGGRRKGGGGLGGGGAVERPRPRRRHRAT